jgi:hypothetical protein
MGAENAEITLPEPVVIVCGSAAQNGISISHSNQHCQIYAEGPLLFGENRAQDVVVARQWCL